MKILVQKRKMILVLFCLLALSWGCEQTNGAGGPVNSPVVLLGDSIFAMSGEIKNELQRLSGEQFRSYYVGGAELENSKVSNIPDQYTEAIKTNPAIKTIILDGGGNDVQIGGGSACKSTTTVSAQCKNALQAPLDAAEKLFTAMRAGGVQNIIYMNYFYIQNENKKPAFDWMHDQMEILAGKHNCILVDPMPYMNPDYIGPDNMHPNAEGSQMLAGLIWDAMQANNIDPATGLSNGSGGGGGNSNSGCGNSF
jgi:lysophospholipase L1-like esterase